MGLYVHIPFCSIKCFYCDFTAFSGQDKSKGRYLAALSKEAALYDGPAPETLYVGGGTPTELTVYARYTRRGGLDINPYRSTHPNPTINNPRLVRQ